MKRILAFFLVLSLLFCAGCGQASAPVQTEPVPLAETDLSGRYVLDPLRKEAIIDDAGQITAASNTNALAFYQIFVGSFSDSNGDGIGDLRGIINRMDYLNDGDPNSGVSLGIEGIWLSPIFTSPTYHKYDASSYYEIDPQFGTMEDLQELVDLCHTRGVKVILDLVINHTATGHPWFQEFKKAQQAGDTENEYYDFYSWSADPASGKAWAPIPGTDHSYECNFFSGMPELNFDNEAVCQAMVDVAAYYLDMGLDGFRFDAAKYIYYGEEDRNVAFWEWYMGKLREIKPDIYSVAEVWDDDSLVLRYTTSTNCFNFSMSQPSGRIAETAKAGDVNAFMAYMNHYIDQMKGYNPQAFPVTFIANHDMDRAAGFLTVASGQAKIAANLSMLLPGSSFIYYGEEIGLKGSRGGANTDANRRLAMFWGDGDTVKDPEGTTYNSEQTNGSVADQLPDGDSLYNHYKKLILIRKANPEIANGSFQALNNPDSKLGGFLATWEGSTVAVLHNTTTAPLQVDLAVLTDIPLAQISAYAGMGGAVLEGTVLTLDGQTSVVLR